MIIEIFDFIPVKILWDTGEVFFVGFCYYDSGRNLVIPIGDTAPVGPLVDRMIFLNRLSTNLSEPILA
jgi:hypothetical protein